MVLALHGKSVEVLKCTQDRSRARATIISVQAKPKSAASVIKNKLFSLQRWQKFGSNTGQVMEGERGESGKAADFCKGAEAWPSCKKGKKMWLERIAEETGICYSYSCVKGGEGIKQSLSASWGRRSLLSATPLPRGVGHGSRLSFTHLQEYFFLREENPGMTRSRLSESCILEMGQRGTWKFWTKCLCPHAFVQS